MVTILVLANSDMGLIKFRKELLHELISLDYKVYISVPKGEYIEALVGLGCEYIETPIDRRGTNPITDLMLLKAYFKMVKDIKPNIVLTYTIKPNIYGGIICRMMRIPYLTNITGLGTAVENKGILRRVTIFLYRIALKKASCVFFQNNDNKKFLDENNVRYPNCRLIPGSGVNLDEYKFEAYPVYNNETKFVFIGRIMKDKGIGELLQAIKKIKAIYPNTQFNIIGDCEEDYKNDLLDMERNGLLRYHGRQNDVRPYIKECHATILPSYHEGTSNVLLETASLGRPVLASDITGCRETFDEGLSGLGFQAKDTDSLVAAIKKFIELPYEMKKDMGYAGRRKMENEYSRKIVIDAYIEQITKILNHIYKG